MSNTINWGKIHGLSYSPETNLTGTAAAPSFTNTKSILLDGVDDFVNMGNVLDMSNDATNSFTISAWFNTTSTSTQMIVTKNLASGTFNGYALYMSSGKLRFLIGANPNWLVAEGGSTVYSDGQWHNIVLVYDGSQNTSGLSFYIDGGLVTTNSLVNNTPTNVISSANFTIGSRNTTHLFFTGKIDEVGIWTSTSLSASDVTSIYNSGVPNDISSLSPVSWWRCGDSDTAPTLTDNGSGGNDGTMTNFSTFSTDVPT